MWHWGTHSLHSFSFETSDKTTASKYKSKISFQIVLHSPPPSQPSLLGKFSSYKSKLSFHLIFIESSRPNWRLNISSLSGKYFTFLKSNQQSSCIERYRDTVPAIISAQWCIMIIHYEPNIKTCPSPRQMQCAASDSQWIEYYYDMAWGRSSSLTRDDGNMQQKWKVANDKASIILVLVWLENSC